MQLKSLELSGFKSFAKRTTIDFVPGVTAVVGPNGSGKSNIVDALRWVLAEQALKNLRGKRGEDFIFHGSSARSSLPRARVELTLANTQEESFLEAEEIVLSREVTRKGDNTYKINGRSVRLMDIEDFLSRSKVGSGSFRILSQGMSDLMLTLGPQELRAFIEEAAGLKEFQDSKERSFRKMELTKDNIQKVEAMLGELEPQLNFLRREVGKYAKRASIESELKQNARAYFSLKHAELAKRERLAHEEKKRIQGVLKDAEKSVRIKTNELSTGVVFSAQEELRLVRAKDHELSRLVIRLEGQLEVEKERSKRILPVSQDYLVERLTHFISLLSSTEKSLITKIKDGLSALRSEIVNGKKPEENRAEVERIQRELKEAHEKQSELVMRTKSLEKEVLEELKKVEHAQMQAVQREKEYIKAYDEIRAHERSLSQVDLEQEKIAVRREQFNHDLLAIGAVSLADVTAVPKNISAHDTETYSQKMWSLKKKLDQIGSIDPAIENEFGAVQERYDFLSREHNDLIQTLAQLSQMIGELEKEIKTRFTFALSGVSKAFGENISLMFGGGEGKVSLISRAEGVEPSQTNVQRGGETDERGIKIDIDLPNKKIKKLSMLSGGERTLISIALLFALVNIRKPPFLVLDEIDAALDEANTNKFVSLVHSRAKDTQFVIITHNRETMRGADAIYGVSMKDGISLLLSLKLEKAVQIDA